MKHWHFTISYWKHTFPTHIFHTHILVEITRRSFFLLSVVHVTDLMTLAQALPSRSKTARMALRPLPCVPLRI